MSTVQDETSGAGASLARFLVGDASRAEKTAAIQRVSPGDSESLAAIRERLPLEPDPVVLATLSSCLGRIGNRTDADRLISCLDHTDARVISNSLEALKRLDVPVPITWLETLLERPEPRLKATVIRLLADLAPERGLAVVGQLLPDADVALRCSLAHLLGELRESPSARPLLLRLLASENQPRVFEQLLQHFRKSVSKKCNREWIGLVYQLISEADESRRMGLVALLRELGLQLGWSEDRVREYGEEYLSDLRDLEDVDQPLTAALSDLWQPPEKHPDVPVPSGPPMTPEPGAAASSPPSRYMQFAGALAIGLLLVWTQVGGNSTIARPMAAPRESVTKKREHKLEAGRSCFSGHARVANWPATPGMHLDIVGQVVDSSDNFLVLRCRGRTLIVEGRPTRGLLPGDRVALRATVKQVTFTGAVHIVMDAGSRVERRFEDDGRGIRK